MPTLFLSLISSTLCQCPLSLVCHLFYLVSVPTFCAVFSTSHVSVPTFYCLWCRLPCVSAHFLCCLFHIACVSCLSSLLPCLSGHFLSCLFHIPALCSINMGCGSVTSLTTLSILFHSSCLHSVSSFTMAAFVSVKPVVLICKLRNKTWVTSKLNLWFCTVVLQD